MLSTCFEIQLILGNILETCLLHVSKHTNNGALHCNHRLTWRTLTDKLYRTIAFDLINEERKRKVQFLL